MNKDSTVRVIKQDEKSGIREDYIKLYHKKGWNIIPLIPGNKTPALKSWKEFEKIKQDESILKEKYWDKVNVAVICGKISENLFVIDCDTEKSALWFIQNFGEYAGTYQVKTRRGIHYYFQVEGEIEKIESFKIRLKNDDIKIDVQGDGRYIVAPPSIVEYDDGITHEYQPVGNLDDVIILSVDEYRELVKKLKSLTKQDVENVVKTDGWGNESENIYEIDLTKFKETIQEYYREGVRQDLVLYSSGFLRKNGIEKDTVIEMFKEICDETGDIDFKQRLSAIELTYKGDIKEIAGYSRLISYIDETKLQECVKRKSTALPNGYIVENGILYELKSKSQEMICEFFDIVYRVVNVKDNTNTGYILRFKNKELLVTVDDLQKQRFGKFITKHVDLIDENTIGKVLKYMTKYILLNKNLLKQKESTDIVGWINGDYYLPQLKTDCYFLGLGNGYEASGEITKEKELLQFLIEEKSYLALGYIVGIASILLHPLGVDNFVVYSSGKTGSGKSTVGFIALSLFGDYEMLKASHDNATTGFELFLKQRNHAVAVMDEANTAQGDIEKIAENLVRNIYKFSNKQGRIRSEKDAFTMKQQIRFEGILYINAEDSLKRFLKLNHKTVQGVLRRTIMIQFDDFERNENFELWTEKVYETIKKHHGNMISEIISIIKNNLDTIKEDYKNFLSYYRDVDQGWMFSGQERALALLSTAVKVLERYTGLGGQFLYDLIDEIALYNHKEFTRCVKITKEDLISEIENWLAENYNNFQVMQPVLEENGSVLESTTKHANKSLFGRVEENRLLLTAVGLSNLANYIQIGETELKKLLVEFELAEKDGTRIIKRTSVKIDGFKLMVYIIKWNQN